MRVGFDCSLVDQPPAGTDTAVASSGESLTMSTTLFFGESIVETVREEHHRSNVVAIGTAISVATGVEIDSAGASRRVEITARTHRDAFYGMLSPSAPLRTVADSGITVTKSD